MNSDIEGKKILNSMKKWYGDSEEGKYFSNGQKYEGLHESVVLDHKWWSWIDICKSNILINIDCISYQVVGLIKFWYERSLHSINLQTRDDKKT